MRPTDWNEVRKTISSCDANKAAGWDGVNSDLVELLTEDSISSPTPFLEILTNLINSALASGCTLKSWRKAVITMVPKRKEDGSFTNLVGEMRPISVLQEFGKIASKMLAERLGQILLEHPKILNSSQRAFLKDGCTSQCIDVALNVLEDYKVKKKQSQQNKLFMMAYDQVKAYDSVQAFTIKASLERFNLPPNFIRYVLSNLEEATSCFKTFFGPTEDIPIEVSVRQGDPLSPLIYVCVADALHAGLRHNPIYGCETGYRFSNMPTVLVSSTGYADDTVTYCESWQEQWMMHEWVRDFCHAHFFLLNAVKCRYFISDRTVDDGRWLWSVDGKDKIYPRPRSEHFKYLGLWMSMDLDWSKEIHTLNKVILDWRWKVFAAKVDSAKLKSAVTEFLFPRLEIGLRHAAISQTQCDAWLSSIIFTICERSGMNSCRNLNRSAFCILSGIPNLWLRTQTSRAAELFVTLNSVNSPAGETTRARLCSLSGQPNLGLALQRLNALKKFSNENENRIITSIKYLKQLGLEIKPRIASEEPAVTAILQELKETFNKYPSAIVYTDGSTEPDGKSPNSGCGIYITDLEHNPIWSGGMVVRADGNNFIAEMAAAAVVIKACPNSDFFLKLRIDSTAAIGAITKGYVSERKRIRAAGRAWRNLCRSAYCEKKKCISVEHVASHQDLETPESKGNDKADKLANDFRLLSANDVPQKYLTSTEEIFILSHDEKVIQSDPRTYMKNLESELLSKDWKRKAPRQVEWFLKHPTQILKQSNSTDSRESLWRNYTNFNSRLAKLHQLSS